FRAGYVSGPYPVRAPEPAVTGTGPATARRILPFTTAPVVLDEPLRPAAPAPATAEAKGGAGLLDVVTEALIGAGPPAHRVWLPPLTTPEPLDTLLGPVVLDPRRGAATRDTSAHDRLRVPIGLVDLPAAQR